MKNIVLVIDWQNRYFENLEKPSKYMHGSVKNTARIIKKARENGDQIVWIGYGGKNPSLWADKEGSIVPELQKLHRYSDPEFIKHTCDTFELPKFDEWISSQNFDRLIFTGYHVDDCVKKTLISAINRKGWGDKCLLVEDACGDKPEHTTIMCETFNKMSVYSGVTITSTKRLIQSFDKPIHGKKYWGSRDPERKKHGYTGCHTIENVVRRDKGGLALLDYNRRQFSDRIRPYHSDITLGLWQKANNAPEDLLMKWKKSTDSEEKRS